MDVINEIFVSTIEHKTSVFLFEDLSRMRDTASVTALDKLFVRSTPVHCPDCVFRMLYYFSFVSISTITFDVSFLLLCCISNTEEVSFHKRQAYKRIISHKIYITISRERNINLHIKYIEICAHILLKICMHICIILSKYVKYI